MLRARFALLVSAAALAGWATVQTPAGGQEVKGQVKIGLHKVKLEQGKLYELKLTSPANATLNVSTRQGILTYVYSPDTAKSRIYFMPSKSEEHDFQVTFG